MSSVHLLIGHLWASTKFLCFLDVQASTVSICTLLVHSTSQLSFSIKFLSSVWKRKIFLRNWVTLAWSRFELFTDKFQALRWTCSVNSIRINSCHQVWCDLILSLNIFLRLIVRLPVFATCPSCCQLYTELARSAAHWTPLFEHVTFSSKRKILTFQKLFPN